MVNIPLDSHDVSIRRYSSLIIMEVKNGGMEVDFTLEGAIFHFYDYGRKGTFSFHVCFSIVILVFGGLHQKGICVSKRSPKVSSHKAKLRDQ